MYGEEITNKAWGRNSREPVLCCSCEETGLINLWKECGGWTGGASRRVVALARIRESLKNKLMKVLFRKTRLVVVSRRSGRRKVKPAPCAQGDKGFDRGVGAGVTHATQRVSEQAKWGQAKSSCPIYHLATLTTPYGGILVEEEMGRNRWMELDHW